MSELEKQEADFNRWVAGLPCDDQPLDAHREALREKALATFDAASAPALLPAWRRRLSEGRQFMRRPLPRLVMVSAACLAIAVAWTLAPRKPATAHAFELFANAIVQAKSATYVMHVGMEGQPNRAMKSSYLAPGKYRFEFEDTVSIADFNAAKSITLLPKTKQAIVVNMKFDSERDKQKSMDIFGQLRDLLSHARDAKTDDYRELGPRTIDGRRALGFSHANTFGEVTMWGDPETGMPVRIEVAFTGVPPTSTVMSDFKLNVELDPKSFALDVPDGYKVQSFDADGSKITEADLVKALRTVSDVEPQEFLDDFTMVGITKTLVRMMGDKVKGKEDISAELMPLSMTIGRGAGFVTRLPASADAHYAGKGVKRDTPDRPIFWYKPEGKQAYRVIYADLTIKEQDQPPQVEGAVRLADVKPPKAAKPEEPQQPDEKK
jgi:outer membrane lipoprotein-sorting protein